MKNLVKSLQQLKEEDHRRALYASLVFIMLMILFFLLVSLEEPDPPIEEKIIEIEMPEIQYEGSQAKGGSSSDSDEMAEQSNENVVEETQEVAQQEEASVEVNSGKGENETEEEDEPQVDNSLSLGKGKGDGKGTGNGDDFGKDNGVGGDGVGNKPGDGKYNPNRKVVKNPTFDAYAQQQGTIALDIWVDNKGNVYKTRLKASESTSGSAYLISLAEKAAKTMKYDGKPGAGLEYVGYKLFTFKKA